MIFNNNYVAEIVDFPERAFYDEEEIKSRIVERNKQRLKAEFKSNNSNDVSIAFNNVIDEEVDNIMLSYEELKSKYGKGETGFLKKVFNAKNETPFVKFLNSNCNLQIKGLKQDKVFSIHAGIWYDRENQQYFVGRTHGYKHKQDKGFQMKKIINHYGAFSQEEFFPLLNVGFIRYKEITVNPFPFKLIDMYEMLIRERIREQLED